MEIAKRNKLISIAAAVIVLVVFLVAVLRPQMNKIRDIRRSSTQARLEIQSQRLTANEIPRLNESVDQMEKKYADFDQRLPHRHELPVFLKEISDACSDGSFAGQEIKPGSPSIGSLYNCLPITMSFDCSYSDLVGLLEDMSHMTRLNRIESLKAMPIKGDENLLKVQMQVNIYFAKS